MDNLFSCRKEQDIISGMNLHFYNNKIIESTLSNAINMGENKERVREREKEDKMKIRN